MNRKCKSIVTVSAAVIGFMVLLIVVCYSLVVRNAEGKTFDNVEEVPHIRVGLLLATSPITAEGEHNYYFDFRIKAADELYKRGKIDAIIASGGDYTSKNGYDEPKAILDSLVRRGIPEVKIILDYEGTRTINSIMNAKNAFELDSVTLISQKYHNERAIYLAESQGLYAIGYNAAPSPVLTKRIRNTLREFLARVKMFIDLYK